MSKAVWLAVTILLAAGCGGASRTERASRTGGGGERSERTEGRRGGADAPSAGAGDRPPSFEAAIAPLRPDGAAPLLAALEAAPADARGYAAAAQHYATTRAGGMTILWGLTYGALAPDGPERVALAQAMATVLAEHVVVTPAGDGLSTSLAPGSMPVLAAADGTFQAPLGHLLEIMLGSALGLSFRGAWSTSVLVAAVTAYVDASRSGSPLDPHVELDAWLRSLADAGHLEAFVIDAFGPGLADGAAAASAHTAEVGAARAWVTAHPFAPTHAVLPDDMLPFRR